MTRGAASVARRLASSGWKRCGCRRGVRSTSDSGSRVVTISATGLADNGYVRSSAYVLRVPYSRMNEALQRVQRLGGRVTDVVVS